MGFLQFSIWVWGSVWRPLPELRYDISFVGVSLKTTRERIFFLKDTVHISFINATDAGGFDLGCLQTFSAFHFSANYKPERGWCGAFSYICYTFVNLDITSVQLFVGTREKSINIPRLV